MAWNFFVWKFYIRNWVTKISCNACPRYLSCFAKVMLRMVALRFFMSITVPAKCGWRGDPASIDSRDFFSFGFALILFVTCICKWPFTLKQYSVRLCYAMEINKIEGQTIDKVGVCLPRPTFSHGQFYVVVWTVTSVKGLMILALDENGEPTTETRNIVYREVLDNL
jgi:hypothetical protein